LDLAALALFTLLLSMFRASLVSDLDFLDRMPKGDRRFASGASRRLLCF
jgi:hypothetical protein